MTRFSANLGFLWSDRPLPGAVRAAKAAGFDAVEVHWPYDTPGTDLHAALGETGLPLLSLNTRRGDVAAGENGLSALPGREDEARAAIDEALAYAAEVGARAVHVMAGNTEGPEARAVFIAALRHATEAAATRDLTILIEPLNPFDAPGYFLRTLEQAAVIIDEIDAPNLKLIFDCYHAQRTGGEIVNRLAAFLPIIGHIQFAGAPARGRPDAGELNYVEIFAHIAALGWGHPLGAEYKPGGDTDATLGWMETLR